MKKLIRITTVPISLDKLLSGQLNFMNQFYKVIGVSSEKEYLERIGKKENIEIECSLNYRSNYQRSEIVLKQWLSCGVTLARLA